MDIPTRRLADGSYAVPRTIAPADPDLPYYALRAAAGGITRCPLTPTMRHILDFPTSTGAWAEDIATLLPWTTVWGVGAAPPRRTTQPNIRHVAGGCYERAGQMHWSFVPPWRAPFDLIHLAGLEHTIPDTVWPDLIAFALDQLAPMGYLEIVLLDQLVGTPLDAGQFLTPAALEIFQEWEAAYYARQGITLAHFAHFERALLGLAWSVRHVLIPYGVPFGQPGNRAALLLRHQFMARMRDLLPAFARTLPPTQFDLPFAQRIAHATSLAFHSEAMFQVAHVYLARRHP